jgi:hypothetical protein
MCTLILARDVLAPRTVLLGANRDERAERPSSPPEVLRARPFVVGGRDRLAGGTWLALREERAAVALLNRRDPDHGEPPSDRRSRGLLTLDVASSAASRGSDRTGVAEDDDGRAALESAEEAVRRDRYAPFSLVYASPGSCWLLAFEHGEIRTQRIARGWHVLTHQELDDPSEPRAAHVLSRLVGRTPASLSAAEALMMERLRSHGEDGAPPVCLHEGVAVTVSSSIVWIDDDGARYLHAEGRPCENVYQDRSVLLESARRAEPSP